MKLNRHQIAGRIVEDPEYGSLPGTGTPTIRMRVVTDDGWYDTKKQEYQKRNTYHTVKRINKDVADMQFRKDDWVMVEGQLLTDVWEDRDGKKRYDNFIRALFIVEVPDPWEKRNAQRSSGSDRRDDRRDPQPDTRRSSRDDYRDERRDDRGGYRDSGSQRQRRDDDIPF